MKTDGILTIGVLLFILWLAITKVGDESRLSILMRALDLGTVIPDAIKPGTSAYGPLSIPRAPNMANPATAGGVPPPEQNAFDFGGFGMVTARDFTATDSYPGPLSNPFSVMYPDPMYPGRIQ